MLLGTTVAHGLIPLALIWLAHISFDRLLGFDLQYATGLVKRTLAGLAAGDRAVSLHDYQMSTRQSRSRRWIRFGTWSAAAIAVPFVAAHALAPWHTHHAARDDERNAGLPGDEIVPRPETGYTMAITIRAVASAIWSWLVQMGQGRGGFYTHEWVENLLGANIDNADRTIAAWQQLDVGDRVRLTPDPYFGQSGQVMTVPGSDRSEHWCLGSSCQV